MPTIDFFDTHVLAALMEEVRPVPMFFKNRYFPTAPEDIIDADKVITEYQRDGETIAAFVAPHVGDIPVAREGYEIREYQPPRIAPSRKLTLDDLEKRGFGEALYPGSAPAERAARLQIKDMTDLTNSIIRREEWMAVQTMINNGCTVQEYVDAKTVGEPKNIFYYDGSSNHTYTVANVWNGDSGDFFGDVRAMCELLASRGLDAADLVLGNETADAILALSAVRELLDKNSGIITGEIDQKLFGPGVSYMGWLNFGGFKLNVFNVSESYVDYSGLRQKYFPATSALVTAPNCGHMVYGRITQIDFGSTEFSTYAAPRVAKLVVDGEHDIRKLRVTARPLAMPRNYCPYIYAANVVA